MRFLGIPSYLIVFNNSGNLLGGFSWIFLHCNPNRPLIRRPEEEGFALPASRQQIPRGAPPTSCTPIFRATNCLVIGSMGAGWSSFTEADKITLFVSLGAFALIFVVATVSCVMLGNDDGFWNFLLRFRSGVSARSPSAVPNVVADADDLGDQRITDYMLLQSFRNMLKDELIAIQIKEKKQIDVRLGLARDGYQSDDSGSCLRIREDHDQFGRNATDIPMKDIEKAHVGMSKAPGGFVLETKSDIYTFRIASQEDHDAARDAILHGFQLLIESERMEV